jgi:50S ribosomal subunit-associated GTPase HflX
VDRETVPVLVVINKIDLLKEQSVLETLVEEWKQLLPNAEIIPVSAQYKFNLDYLLKRIQELLPPSPPFFEKDALTDKPARFFATENNPTIINLDTSIRAMRSNVQATLDATLKGLQITKEDLAREANRYSRRINDAPTQERQFVSIARQQEIKLVAVIRF